MSLHTDAGAVLLERAAELASIDAAIADGIRGRGHLLTIAGAAGVGKTSLMHAARQRARDGGFRVLQGCGGELEGEFGFGVACQLFEAAVTSDPERLLRGRAQLAAPVLGLEDHAVPVGFEDTIYPALQGLYWLCVNLATGQPLALCVDDVQLADRASVRFLAYLTRRLDDLPIIVIAAARSGPAADAVLAALDHGEVLRPRCLSLAATEAVLQTIAPDASAGIARACHEATGGNALFVRELAQAIRDRELERGAVTAADVRTWSPERVTLSVARRLAALAPECRRLAHALAVLGHDARLRHAQALAGLTPETAAAAADGLRGAGILAPGATLEFTHPIVRSAVHDEIAPSARAQTHARAADVLAAEGAPAERIAVHLLRSEPRGDQATGRTLVTAAEQALARGAPEPAAAYLRRALDEPPPIGDRADLLLALATAEGRMFELGAAAAHVREAFELAPDRETRLRAAVLAAGLSGHSGAACDAVTLLRSVEREYGDHADAETSLRALAANTGRFEHEARQLTRATAATLRRFDDTVTDPHVLAAMAAELAMAAEPAEQAISLARRGLDAIGRPGMGESSVYMTLIRVLVISDEFARATEELDRQIAASRRGGSVLDFVFASVFRADAMYRRGDIFEAEADARAAYELALEHRWPATPAILAQLLEALIERGDFGLAEAALTEARLDGPAGELPSLYISTLLLLARGRLRAARGEPEAALIDLLECGRRLSAWGEVNPALLPWRSQAALVHHALGARAQAEQLATEELGLARRFGAPRAVGVALRAAGLVTEGEAGLALATEAVAVLAGSGAPLEHARALADLGSRTIGLAPEDGCQSVLREALDGAHRCGGLALERRVLARLHELGARPRRHRLSGPDALTPSERRVAHLAAAGSSNREIAEALFVTVRTVEFHLANCYRKLGISGRQELRAALGDG